jgi:hypothetical protein
MPADMDEMLTFLRMVGRMRPVSFDDSSDETLFDAVATLNRLIETAKVMSSGTTVTLRERELATLLAALRAFQRLPSEETMPENDIATDAGKFEALTNEEIDKLYEDLIEFTG